MSDVPWRDLKYSRFYVRSVYCSWKKSDLNQNGCEIVQATVTPESRSFPPGQPTSGVSLWAEFPCTCPLERTVQYFELFPARILPAEYSHLRMRSFSRSCFLFLEVRSWLLFVHTDRDTCTARIADQNRLHTNTYRVPVQCPTRGKISYRILYNLVVGLQPPGCR